MRSSLPPRERQRDVDGAVVRSSTVFSPVPFSVIEDVVGFRRARVEAQICVSSPPSARLISFSNCRVADLHLIWFLWRVCRSPSARPSHDHSRPCGQGSIGLLTRSTNALRKSSSAARTPQHVEISGLNERSKQSSLQVVHSLRLKGVAPRAGLEPATLRLTASFRAFLQGVASPRSGLLGAALPICNL